MKRRSLLAGMLAACAAPAYVKAGSLMRLYVPRPSKVWTPDFDLSGLTDFTIEGWVDGNLISELRVTKMARYNNNFHPVMAPYPDKWAHVAVVRRKGLYVNGVHRPGGPDAALKSEIDRMAAVARGYLENLA